jgi:hypothetical protein
MKNKEIVGTMFWIAAVLFFVAAAILLAQGLIE